jgi:hypothetical protein|tara:strand:+ start:257 stop:622 length:366 start_codon:yes stop_codon:yes gene_type:complete
MSNQHLKMQEDLYSKIEYHLARLYDEETRTFIYNGERITKFNFEEFASDTEVIEALFEQIKDRVWHMYEVHFGEFQMLSEEAEYYDEFAEEVLFRIHSYANEYLYNLLDEDVQELRASEQP